MNPEEVTVEDDLDLGTVDELSKGMSGRRLASEGPIGLYIYMSFRGNCSSSTPQRPAVMRGSELLWPSGGRPVSLLWIFCTVPYISQIRNYECATR